MTFNKQINGFDFFSEYGKSNALFWGGTIRGEGKIEPNDDGMPITSYTIEPTGNTRAENALSEFLHELKAEMEKPKGNFRLRHLGHIYSVRPLAVPL